MLPRCSFAAISSAAGWLIMLAAITLLVTPDAYMSFLRFRFRCHSLPLLAFVFEALSFRLLFR